MDEKDVSKEVLKDRIIFKTINEGLAVMIGEQSLRKHHEKQGINFDAYVQESFSAFNEFMITTEQKELEEMFDQEFQNAGHFYVVGNEIAKAVLQEEGMVNFKKIIEESRENPEKILEIYREIQKHNPELSKIIFNEV